MSQAQLRPLTKASTRLKSAFWGRESLSLTFLIYCLVGMFAAFVLVSPLTQWLGNLPALGNSRLGMVGLMVLTMTIPGVVAGGVTARFSPRWCLIPWVVINTWYFLFRMLPELQKTWKDGAWQFWMLAVACAVGFMLQTWVLFTIRRRVIHRLSTAGDNVTPEK